jgi:hypothetical protein
MSVREWELESDWKCSSYCGTEMIFVIREESDYGFPKKQGFWRMRYSSVLAGIMVAFVVVLLCSTAVIIRALWTSSTSKK